MGRLRLLSLAAAISLVGASAQAAAPADRCLVEAEATAVSVRLVQTELMVAALSCNFAPRYNAFVHKFQPELAAGHKRVIQTFGRLYGSDGARQANSFITRTANETSDRSIQKPDEFCARSADIYAKAEQTDRKQLHSLVADVQLLGQAGLAKCQAPARDDAVHSRASHAAGSRAAKKSAS